MKGSKFISDLITDRILTSSYLDEDSSSVETRFFSDTNSDPDNIDFVIPANDDATKSIEVILDACCAAMQEGIEERKVEKIDMEAAGEEEVAEKAPKAARPRKAKARMDKRDEDALNAAKAADFIKEED